MKLQTINGKEDFEKKVMAATGTYLVEFGADWCPPCRALEPVLLELSETLKGSLEIYKVDVDKNPDIAEQFGVRSLPTVIIFRNGTIQEKLIGYKTRSAYISALTGNKLKP